MNKNYIKISPERLTFGLLAAGCAGFGFGYGAILKNANADTLYWLWQLLGCAFAVISAMIITEKIGKPRPEVQRGYTITSKDQVDGMEGHRFEHFCADLLIKNGFSEVEVTRGSGDQGVDILAVKDDISYAIQCKNYSSPLTNTPVQEVYAGKTFYGCHVGAVMTNSTFTKSAKALADSTGIILWDKDRIDEMMANTQK